MHRHIDFPSSSGKATIEALHWPYENPRGVVQLCHGMCEHIGRYDEFARFLNEHGFAVVGNNHLGHGASLIDGQFGYIGDLSRRALLPVWSQHGFVHHAHIYRALRQIP